MQDLNCLPVPGGLLTIYVSTTLCFTHKCRFLRPIQDTLSQGLKPRKLSSGVVVVVVVVLIFYSASSTGDIESCAAGWDLIAQMHEAQRQGSTVSG